MKINIRKWKDMGTEERNTFFSRSETDISGVLETVETIIRKVENEGDSALAELTRKFEGADLGKNGLRVTEKEIADACNLLPQELKDAIDYSIENIEAFHRPQKPEAMTFSQIRPGIFAGEKASPIESLGMYVPRGRGSFPSMLYMLAVPAAIAGVPRRVVVTPPAKDGSVDAACLYAAARCGVTEIYKVGGAQAVAALAVGTETIRPVVKLTGPGSMYVAAAKRLLHGRVDVGLPAGPSESIVLADADADPRKAALDLLIEAEHGSDSSAVLVTPSGELAALAAAEINNLVDALPEPRKTFVSDVLSGYGGIIITEDMEEAAAVVNEFAPEHLQLQTSDPFQTLSLIENAGEILLGDTTPFSIANYSTGANAVLPTGGRARTFSAVSVRDFIKYSSVVYASEEGLAACAPHVKVLADYEGFVTHADALRRRGL